MCKKSASKLDVYYSLDVRQQQEKYAAYWQTLDQREQGIAQRFKQTKLTQRYVFAHGLLRETLAGYVAESAEKLVFSLSERGKPFLLDYPELSFNLSHTENAWALAVVQSECQLGIDIEYFKQRESWKGLVKKCFSPEESEYWHALNVEQQGCAFYQLWVRKEAFVKAVGQGITLGLNQCVLQPNTLDQFLRVPNKCGLAEDWRIYPLNLAEGLLAAVVCNKVVCNQKELSLKLTKISNA
ncbi:MAG: 4'-phosphopantetheinyl transferase superfamily protein [Methyloprofundus sp.]|nr:4'-phosphopantetheinyl transferase superfamily protein [Methyloprofundus sp.]